MKTQNAHSLYLENQLCFPLYAASRLTTQIYTPLLQELGLTYPQYLVMLVLWKSDGHTVNEICEKLVLATNTVTPLVKRLEEKQLVQRKRSQKDERVVNVYLTQAGISLREKALGIPEKILDQFRDDSPDINEIMQLQKTLFKLIETLRKKSNEQLKE